jgi:MFS family permease
LATTTKGLGLVIGPLAAGATIDILGPSLEHTHGYQALWPVLGIPIILAMPLVALLARAEAAAEAEARGTADAPPPV